jgi:hypothetical protein
VQGSCGIIAAARSHRGREGMPHAPSKPATSM